MSSLLAEQPLLLLFLVAAVGVALGRIRLLGVRLGMAAVLFAGLALGAFDPRWALPEVVMQLGLALFVYTIGLANGRAFLRSFGPSGLRANGLVLCVLIVGAVLTLVAARLLGWDPATAAGLFAGATTNTPALAGVVEALHSAEPQRQAAPVVAYSLAYPGGVLGVILSIALLQRLRRRDDPATAPRDHGEAGERLSNLTVRLTRPELSQAPIEHWREREGWHVILGRFRRAGEVELVGADTVLQPGDEVSIIGAEADLRAVASRLGEVTDAHLEFDRSKLDFRRVFVSEPSVAGRSLADLRLPQRLGAIVTRVRRGDLDLLPDGGLRLELGDRVRVVARRDRMEEVARFFGDSYHALSEVDVPTLALGLCAGLLLGALPIPLPGGGSLELGFAGGPLLVALALGAVGRSGRWVWTLPYSANLTLRQIGLLFFLAAVGTRSGYAFFSTLRAGQGLDLLLAGLVITLLLTSLTLFIGHRWLRMPMDLAAGVACGQQTQPAALGYAVEQMGNDRPQTGYATVFPLATIAKIVLAQVLLTLV